MRYLITGEAGFIHSRLVDALSTGGDVVMLDDDLSRRPSRELPSPSFDTTLNGAAICDRERLTCAEYPDA